MALNCKLNHTSYFDRKHYFYADLPAGYQITQKDHPIALDGYFDYVWPIIGSVVTSNQHCSEDSVNSSLRISRARILRLHLEQDAGKSVHDLSNSRSLIDLNRSGVGLAEVVTQPDFHSGVQAASFVAELANLLAHLDVCSAEAALGELRVDANI
ncbi:unnamed protein product, partial [Protopolystoma xenopodis]